MGLFTFVLVVAELVWLGVIAYLLLKLLGSVTGQP